MKQLTQDILNILNSDNFTDLFSFEESVKINGFEDEKHQDVSFKEAYFDLINIRDILIESIKKNDLFERLTTYSTRNFTISTLTSIDTHITTIKNKSNVVPSFIQAVESLKDKLNVHLISLSIKGLPLYYKKLQDVSYLKSRYSKLISELKKAERIKKDTDDIFNDVAEKYEGITESADGIEETQNTIDSIKEDIDKRYEQIKINDKNISDYEIQSKNNKDEIAEFFTQIDENAEKMDSLFKDSKTYIDQSKIKINKNIEDNTFNTEQLINANESIQQNIYDLLGKAVGTNLYKSFNKKVNWMRYQSIFWFAWLIISIGFLAWIGTDVIEMLNKLLENGQNNNLGLSFYLKTTLVFPAIYAIYFSASQFKSTNKLLEEYEFKSAVSVVLHYFKDQVEKTKEDDETKKFLIRAIEKIFESPTDKVFGRKLSTRKKESLLNEIVDFTKDNVKNILPTD